MARLAALALTFLVALVIACGRSSGGDGGNQAAQPTASPTPPPVPEPSPSPSPPSGTPAPPAGTPAPSPTAPPGPRIVNGLLIVDEVWGGIVRERGGLRIRSAPRVEVGNVVGSLAEGTPVTVEGRVLNGQEAEPGKGTEWLIVGPSQYIYGAPGYVERIR